MTDNITPLAPQTKAPMTTEEIIDRLKQVSFTYSRLTADTFSSGEVARDKQALTAGIRAVELLEEIKAAVKGRCKFCKHHAAGTADIPCRDCFTDNDLWEFRWPLGEEGEQ